MINQCVFDGVNDKSTQRAFCYSAQQENRNPWRGAYEAAKKWHQVIPKSKKAHSESAIKLRGHSGTQEAAENASIACSAGPQFRPRKTS